MALFLKNIFNRKYGKFNINIMSKIVFYQNFQFNVVGFIAQKMGGTTPLCPALHIPYKLSAGEKQQAIKVGCSQEWHSTGRMRRDLILNPLYIFWLFNYYLEAVTQKTKGLNDHVIFLRVRNNF